MERASASPCARRALRCAAACGAAAALSLASASARAQDAAAQPVRGHLTVSFAEYFECGVDNAFVRGESVLLSGGGFAPNEPIALQLAQGDERVPIASVRATPRGGLSAIVAIPAAAPTDTEVRIFATSEKGETGAGRSLRSPVLRVFADARDSDGDGEQDRCDLCPELAGPSGEDSDLDGRGDACDRCPNDGEDDSDGDGLCADVDPNPYAPESGAAARENG
jgi:hypothetical protein